MTLKEAAWLATGWRPSPGHRPMPTVASLHADVAEYLHFEACAVLCDEPSDIVSAVEDLCDGLIREERP